MAEPTRLASPLRPLSEADRLTEKNYGDWAQHIESVLDQANLWDHMKEPLSTEGTRSPTEIQKEKDAKYVILGSIASIARNTLGGI